MQDLILIFIIKIKKIDLEQKIVDLTIQQEKAEKEKKEAEEEAKRK